MLAEIFESLEEYKKALEFYKKHVILDSQIQGKELARKLEQMKSQHEIQTMGQEKELFRLKNVDMKSAYDIIADKNKEILDSIHYAKRIQQSILTTEKYIEKNLIRLLK